METRRGRRSVIDLTAPSESPPEIPRPLIATASIAPRRRLRDGSHSSRSSSTATIPDRTGYTNNAIPGGSRNRAAAPDRRNSDGIRASGSTSSSSHSATSRTVSRTSTGESRSKRARLRVNSDEDGTSRSGGEGSRAVSRSSRPSNSTTASTAQGRPATIADFEIDSSDEALNLQELSSRSGSVEAEDEDDKTDAMTVNTDTIGEIQQYDIVRDSSAELRNPRANPVVVQDEFDPLANDEDIYISDNKTDDDDFEVVSHVKKEPKMPYHGAGPGRADSKGKGKGKVPAKVDPDEPPENLLASFECPICFMPPVQAVLTPCGHIMCGKCLFDTLKSQAIRDGKRPNPVGQYPPTRHPPGKRRTKKELEWERTRPVLRGRILSGSCPVCRMELEGGLGTVPGEGGVKHLEIRTVTEL
ncbi:hypothetical protein NCC49_001618 [Naganishia albida]|nr:hypothetical protein NCC49_001618 [Naganishia albida]